MNRLMLLLLVVIALLYILVGCSTQRSIAKLEAGDLSMVSGDYERAVKNYRESTELSPSDQAYTKLAWGMIKTGDFNGALDSLSRLSPPISSEGEYLYAVACLGNNDVADAYLAVERSLQKNPDNSLSLAMLGRIKFLQKQYAESIEAYQKSLVLSSDEQIRSDLHYNLAMAHMAAGHFQQADQHFRQYLSQQKYIDNQNHKLAGTIAYAVGDHKRAYSHWKHLDAKQKQVIAESIVTEDQVYNELTAKK